MQKIPIKGKNITHNVLFRKKMCRKWKKFLNSKLQLPPATVRGKLYCRKINTNELKGLYFKCSDEFRYLYEESNHNQCIEGTWCEIYLYRATDSQAYL